MAKRKSKNERIKELTPIAEQEIPQVERVSTVETFKGKACRYGHVDENNQSDRVKNGINHPCIVCTERYYTTRNKKLSKDACAAEHKQWCENNKEHAQTYQREYHAKRRAEHPEYYATYHARVVLKKLTKEHTGPESPVKQYGPGDKEFEAYINSLPYLDKSLD